jgi:hypothetical protein
MTITYAHQIVNSNMENATKGFLELRAQAIALLHKHYTAKYG